MWACDCDLGFKILRNRDAGTKVGQRGAMQTARATLVL